MATTTLSQVQTLKSEPSAVITATNLTKTFGARSAVKDLNMSVPAGKIVGFVGPNGAGKTTTIRILLGLLKPTSGGGSVLGQSIGHPPSYLARVGALIETPAFYPTLSGRANLSVLSTLGGLGKERIPALLETVGLQGREGDKVGSYSLGMKQRLGIAAALLPDPELLILDEPANGLDPEGIIEMRELLRSLRDTGKSIFVSSHLLGELEQMAEWLVVLKDGQAVYTGPTSELTSGDGGGFQLSCETPNELDVVARVITSLGFTYTAQNGGLHVSAPHSAAAAINRETMKAGATLTEIHHIRASLEEVFLHMITGGSDV